MITKLSWKKLAIGCGALGLLLAWIASNESENLSIEYRLQGDGVEYLDPRPLNQGGTFLRNPETDWEQRSAQNDRVFAFAALLMISACYFMYRHWVE
jgi:hypothetical protein